MLNLAKLLAAFEYHIPSSSWHKEKTKPIAVNILFPYWQRGNAYVFNRFSYTII